MKKKSQEPDDDMTPEEKAKLRKEVEKLFTQSARNAPCAFVLETMRVDCNWLGIKKPNHLVKVHSDYKHPITPVFDLIKRIALKVYWGPEEAHGNVIIQSIAIFSEPGEMENLGLTCEAIWLREVDCDELFISSDKVLLLQSRNIRIISSEFVEHALRNHLSTNGNDARLAVLHAAEECIMDELGDDLGLISDRFSDVAQTINEILADIDWFSLTREDIINLTLDVIRRVP